MKTIHGYIEDMTSLEPMTDEKISQAIDEHERSKGALNEVYRSAIDELIDEVLRLRFPDRAAAAVARYRTLEDHADAMMPRRGAS